MSAATAQVTGPHRSEGRGPASSACGSQPIEPLHAGDWSVRAGRGWLERQRAAGGGSLGGHVSRTIRLDLRIDADDAVGAIRHAVELDHRKHEANQQKPKATRPKISIVPLLMTLTSCGSLA